MKLVWLVWTLTVLVSFAVLELAGYFGAGWGTLTEFVRDQERVSVLVKWALLLGGAVGVTHLVGDWP